MKTTSVIASAVALMAGTAAAAPLQARGELIAADIVATIAPKSVNCQAGGECRNNKEVGEAFIQSFLKYGIYNPAAMASILALTALESDEYRAKKNYNHDSDEAGNEIHWGQGTSNMQMFTFNLQFANSIPEIASQVKGISAESADKATKNKVLDLVTDDKYNFETGPWYLMKSGQPGCGQEVLSVFESGTPDAGYAAHMACVGIKEPNDASRIKYWNLAKTAFGLK